MLNVIKTFLVATLAIFTLSTQAQAAEKPLAGKNLVVMVSAADVNKAGMGIGIGAVASADAGANVTIVIGAGALKYVLKKSKDTHFKPMNKKLQDVVTMALNGGANVYVCGMFAKAEKISDADLVSGVKIVDGAAIFGKVYTPGTQIISF